MSANITEVENITKSIKDATDKDVETSVLNIWAKSGWIFWSLTLKDGKTSGFAKAAPDVTGVADFWTVQVSLGSGVQAGKFGLEIKSMFSHLTLNGPGGKEIGSYTFGGLSQKSLVGDYKGSWAVST